MTTTVNIHEAKTHLSRLVEQAAKGSHSIPSHAAVYTSCRRWRRE